MCGFLEQGEETQAGAQYITQELTSVSSVSPDTEILGALDHATLLPCLSAPHLNKKRSPTHFPWQCLSLFIPPDSIRGSDSHWGLLVAQHGEGLQSWLSQDIN